MIITYYGLEFFKLQRGDLTVAINPISKKSQHKSARFGAHIALVSAHHPDFNGAENLSYGEKEPFIISGPGEYEIKGVAVRGYETKTKYGKEEHGINTIYFLSFDGMDICFLGALSDSRLPENMLEDIHNVDILFVPIGGKGVLTSQEAYKTSLSFGPSVIIPMHFDNSSLKKFLEEAGIEGVKPVDKLTIKKKDLEGKEGEIVVLKHA